MKTYYKDYQDYTLAAAHPTVSVNLGILSWLVATSNDRVECGLS